MKKMLWRALHETLQKTKIQSFDRASSHPQIKYVPSNRSRLSLDELLGFEETSQIQHLPGGEAKEATHAKYAEEQDSVVCGFCKKLNVSPAAQSHNLLNAHR